MGDRKSNELSAEECDAIVKLWCNRSKIEKLTDKLQRKLQDEITRRNGYDKFPSALNIMMESIFKIKIDDAWSRLYDSVVHIHELYYIRWQLEVCILFHVITI